MLINLNVCHNHLYATDPDLRDFLDNLQPGWEDCQSLPANADFDRDGDVDGSDLKSFMDDPGDLSLGIFSEYFGAVGWGGK